MVHAPLSHLLKYCHLKPIINPMSLRWSAAFTDAEYRRIMSGHEIGEQDRWVMLAEGEDLHIYRAASGECAFVIRFLETNGGRREVVAVEVAPFVQAPEPLELLSHLIGDLLQPR